MGKQLVDAAKEVKAPKKFVNDVRDAMDANIKFTDYGPKAGIGSKYEKRSTAGPVATAVAGMAGRFLVMKIDIKEHLDLIHFVWHLTLQVKLQKE